MNKRRGLIIGFVIGFLYPFLAAWGASGDWRVMLEILERFNWYIMDCFLTGCGVGIFGTIVGWVFEGGK